jgi:hypothetical protein
VKHEVPVGSCDGGCVFGYRGAVIYNAECGQFEIGEETFRPHAIGVLTKRELR